MEQKKEKLRRTGWKSRFVRLTSILMLGFNTLSAPLTTIGIATLAVATTVLVVSCDKDDINQQQEPNQQQKHNVELRYDGRTGAGCVNIAMDTIYKYNTDPTVDTIFMIPEPKNQFATWNATQMRDAVNYLRPRHNVNPNKVFGKGDIKLNSVVLDQNPEIVRFFGDTLKYNVRNCFE